MVAADGTGVRERLLAATRRCLLDNGFAGLSTRVVADTAGVPLSQIHYHFGSKQQLVLAVLDAENERLLRRQRALYDQQIPLWKRWEQACDALEDDLASGYVRVLQEMIAAGWSDARVSEAVRASLAGWYTLLESVAGEAEERVGSLGPFTAGEIAALTAHAFLGAEAVILLGVTEETVPARSALRKIGLLLRDIEETGT
ncbi:MAG: TetR family transcriptional regulator [Nitriliruptorales bacterium]|nr:TetR family transcriptional regulator [Nitriliruptorales bacterium]